MCLDTTSTPAASGFICCNLERCPLPKCQVCYDRLQSCSLSVILEKMSASDSQRQPLFPSARKSVKYLKPPLFSLRMFWTIKDDLCKLYSYFMHDKHHYLDNYCSRERERETQMEEKTSICWRKTASRDFVSLKSKDFLEARDVVRFYNTERILVENDSICSAGWTPNIMRF